MSYKNDSYLVIVNKYGGFSSDARAQLFETYDLLRDLTVSGSASDGGGFGTAGSFLWKLASMIAPASFMSTMGGGTAINIPGTSYWSPSVPTAGVNSSFGIGSLSNYIGFTGAAAPVVSGFGSSNPNRMEGYMTGGASAVQAVADIADSAGVNALTYTAGMASGFGFGDSFLLPAAGVISGFGGILQAVSPYLGTFGVGSTMIGNLLQGITSAPLAAYQKVTSAILANADTVLENKVKNIETVCKMLDAQNDVVKKLLQEDMNGMKDKIQNIGG